MIVDKTNYGIHHFHNSKKLTTGITKRPDDIISERNNHLNEALNCVNIDGDILEFGVWEAKSINQIADKFKDKTIHGFDSFEGLPEDWPTQKIHLTQPVRHPKGHFALEKLPEVRDNVKLWVGWFNETIPQFKETNKNQISFLHVDGDLYSSAKTVFDELNDYIVKDTVIVFDEFYAWGRKPYQLWEDGEYKACKEWVEKYDRKFEVLYHNNHQQTSIKIIQ